MLRTRSSYVGREAEAWMKQKRKESRKTILKPLQNAFLPLDPKMLQIKNSWYPVVRTCVLPRGPVWMSDWELRSYKPYGAAIRREREEKRCTK